MDAAAEARGDGGGGSRRRAGAAAVSDIPEMAARFAELPPAGGAAGRTMEEISEFFRRDSRRYDNGFTGGDDR